MGWKEQNTANYHAEKAQGPAVVEDKAKARANLNADIEEYLARGGEITRVPTGDTAVTISKHISKSFPKSL